MADYYFISQLPSLDGISDGSPLPVTEERFDELCGRFLKGKAERAARELTLSPPKQHKASGFDLIDTWNESERNLRFALGKVRAERMKKSFDTESRILPSEYLKAAAIAAESENPLEAEKYLNGYRLKMLEELRPTDIFSENYIFYYGLKLKLLLRIRQLDRAAGEKAYKNIYSSVLNKYRTEEEQ